MKLKVHRNDVKDLRLQADAHVQAIAGRYQRLILAMEAYFTDVNLMTLERGNRRKRVMEDAKGK